MNKNDLLKCKECGMIMEVVSLGKECGVAKPEVEVLEAKLKMQQLKNMFLMLKKEKMVT